MEADPVTLLTIAGMALATYVTRAGGFLLMRFMNVRGRLKAALDAMPPAILMAVTVFATGVAETLAAIITALAAIARLPIIAVVLIGVVSVVVLRMAV